jgi:hypothetical protein
VILAKVYDPLEQSGPGMKVIAGDSEKQLVMDGSDEKLRTKFRASFDEEFDSFKTQMKKHRVPVFLIDTVQEVDTQLKEIFKGKAR